MMRYLMLLTLCFGIVLTAQSQKEMKPRHDEADRFESMKIAHLTEMLELTPEKAQVFWPIYNEYNDQKRAIRESSKPVKRFEEMSDQEAENFISAVLASRQELAILDKSLMVELEDVLTPSQRVKLVQSESQFHKTVVRKFKKRKEEREKLRKKRTAREE